MSNVLNAENLVDQVINIVDQRLKETYGNQIEELEENYRKILENLGDIVVYYEKNEKYKEKIWEEFDKAIPSLESRIASLENSIVELGSSNQINRDILINLENNLKLNYKALDKLKKETLESLGKNKKSIDQLNEFLDDLKIKMAVNEANIKEINTAKNKFEILGREIEDKIKEHDNNYKFISKQQGLKFEEFNKKFRSLYGQLRLELIKRIEEFEKTKIPIQEQQQKFEELIRELEERLIETDEANNQKLRKEFDEKISIIELPGLPLNIELKLDDLEEKIKILMTTRGSLPIDDIKELIMETLQNKDVNEKFISQIMAKLKNQIEDFLNSYRIKIEKLIGSIEEKNEDYENKLRKYQELIKELENLNISDINGQVKRLQGYEKEFTAKIEQLNNEFEKYQTEVEQLKGQYEEKMRLFDNSRKGLEKLIQENKKYSEELDLIEQKYQENLRKIKETLDKELLEKLAEIRKFITEHFKNISQETLKKVYDDIDTKIRGNNELYNLNEVKELPSKFEELENRLDLRISNILKNKIGELRLEVLEKIKKTSINAENLRSINDGLKKIDELQEKMESLKINEILARLQAIESDIGPMNQKIGMIIDLLTKFINFDLSHKFVL